MADIEFHLLSKTIDTSSFDCGDDDLNDFLQTDALKNQNEWLSVTKVLVQNQRVVGYFTITPDTLHKGRIDFSDKLAGYPYQKYPAIKLARLAVDKRYQHKGIGKMLMSEFFSSALDAVSINGGRFITVDAKNSARSFYEMYNFKLVTSQKISPIISMYLDFRSFYTKSLSLL